MQDSPWISLRSLIVVAAAGVAGYWVYYDLPPPKWLQAWMPKIAAATAALQPSAPEAAPSVSLGEDASAPASAMVRRLSGGDERIGERSRPDLANPPAWFDEPVERFLPPTPDLGDRTAANLAAEADGGSAARRRAPQHDAAGGSGGAPVWGRRDSSPRETGLIRTVSTGSLAPREPPPSGIHSGNSAGGSASARSASDRFHFTQQRLRELGATYLRLQAFGRKADVYEFRCEFPMPRQPGYVKFFETTDSDPLRAMERVLADAEAWQANERQRDAHRDASREANRGARRP